MRLFQNKRVVFFRRALSLFVLFHFLTISVLPQGISYAQVAPQLSSLIITPGVNFNPAVIKGVNIHPDNPFKFDFIIDQGDAHLSPEDFKKEANKLIKYFLASLTVPEEQTWVNLSPYEKDRIMAKGFDQTAMAQDMLVQDYLLKQLTASFMQPESDLGKKFWNRIYTKAKEKFGTTEIPVNTFNKIWIVPEKAFVYEHGKGAFIVESHLKVMLEEDYFASRQSTDHSPQDSGPRTVDRGQTQIIREILIPEIEKEVNEGKTFANLRQIFHSMILATWYKQALRESILGKVYADKNKVKGIESENSDIKEKVYEKYLEAYKKGTYGLVKEDYDPTSQQVISRKYFTGGVTSKGLGQAINVSKASQAMLSAADHDKTLLAVQKIRDGREVTMEMVSPSSKNDAAMTGPKTIEFRKPLETFHVVSVSALNESLNNQGAISINSAGAVQIIDRSKLAKLNGTLDILEANENNPDGQIRARARQISSQIGLLSDYASGLNARNLIGIFRADGGDEAMLPSDQRKAFASKPIVIPSPLESSRPLIEDLFRLGRDLNAKPKQGEVLLPKERDQRDAQIALNGQTFRQKTQELITANQFTQVTPLKTQSMINSYMGTRSPGRVLFIALDRHSPIDDQKIYKLFVDRLPEWMSVDHEPRLIASDSAMIRQTSVDKVLLSPEQVAAYQQVAETIKGSKPSADVDITLKLLPINYTDEDKIKAVEDFRAIAQTLAGYLDIERGLGGERHYGIIAVGNRIGIKYRASYLKGLRETGISTAAYIKASKQMLLQTIEDILAREVSRSEEDAIELVLTDGGFWQITLSSTVTNNDRAMLQDELKRLLSSASNISFERRVQIEPLDLETWKKDEIAHLASVIDWLTTQLPEQIQALKTTFKKSSIKVAKISSDASFVSLRKFVPIQFPSSGINLAAVYTADPETGDLEQFILVKDELLKPENTHKLIGGLVSQLFIPRAQLEAMMKSGRNKVTSEEQRQIQIQRSQAAISYLDILMNAADVKEGAPTFRGLLQIERTTIETNLKNVWMDKNQTEEVLGGQRQFKTPEGFNILGLRQVEDPNVLMRFRGYLAAQKPFDIVIESKDQDGMTIKIEGHEGASVALLGEDKRSSTPRLRNVQHVMFDGLGAQLKLVMKTKEGLKINTLTRDGHKKSETVVAQLDFHLEIEEPKYNSGTFVKVNGTEYFKDAETNKIYKVKERDDVSTSLEDIEGPNSEDIFLMLLNVFKVFSSDSNSIIKKGNDGQEAVFSKLDAQLEYTAEEVVLTINGDRLYTFDRKDATLVKSNVDQRFPGPIMAGGGLMLAAVALIFNKGNVGQMPDIRSTSIFKNLPDEFGDAAMLVNKPYPSVDQMYQALPNDIVSLIDDIAAKLPDSRVIRSNKDNFLKLMNTVAKIYNDPNIMGDLTTQNYHNHLHNLVVSMGSLFTNSKAELIYSSRDLIGVFLAALFHDFHVRAVRPKQGGTATPAWVDETLGKKGTKEGGQLKDLFGVGNFKYATSAIANARYENVPEELKEQVREALQGLVGTDLEDIYIEVEAMIRRTDFASDVAAPKDIYRGMANAIRDYMDGEINQLKDGQILTDERFEALITEVEERYKKIYELITKQEPMGISNSEIWINRQRGIELSFLDALSKVNPQRRAHVYQMASRIEMSDQSVSAWIGTSPVTESITLGLREELSFVSIEANFLFFYMPQLLPARVLARLRDLPLNFRINFYKNMEYFAKYPEEHKEELGETKYKMLQASWSEWKKIEENVLMELRLFKDRDGKIKEQLVEAALVDGLRKSFVGEVFNLTDIYYMVKNRAVKLKKLEPHSTLIREGEKTEGIYIVYSGQLDTFKGGLHFVLGPGEYVGELATISRLPRNATVTTTDQPAVLIQMDARYLHGLRLTSDEFNSKLFGQIRARMRSGTMDLPSWVESDIVMKMDRSSQRIRGSENILAWQDPHFIAGQESKIPRLSEPKVRDLLTPVLADIEKDFPEMGDVKLIAIARDGESVNIYTDPIDRKSIIVFSSNLFQGDLDGFPKRIKEALHRKMTDAAMLNPSGLNISGKVAERLARIYENYDTLQLPAEVTHGYFPQPFAAASFDQEQPLSSGERILRERANFPAVTAGDQYLLRAIFSIASELGMDADKLFQEFNLIEFPKTSANEVPPEYAVTRGNQYIIRALFTVASKIDGVDMEKVYQKYKTLDLPRAGSFDYDSEFRSFTMGDKYILKALLAIASQIPGINMENVYQNYMKNNLPARDATQYDSSFRSITDGDLYILKTIFSILAEVPGVDINKIYDRYLTMNLPQKSALEYDPEFHYITDGDIDTLHAMFAAAEVWLESADGAMLEVPKTRSGLENRRAQILRMIDRLPTRPDQFVEAALINEYVGIEFQLAELDIKDAAMLMPVSDDLKKRFADEVHYFTILGPPGAGKGTLSAIIDEINQTLPEGERYVKLVTGDYIRGVSAIRSGKYTPEQGALYGQYKDVLTDDDIARMKRGELIDEASIRLINVVLNEDEKFKNAKRIFFDGFPRTPGQWELIRDGKLNHGGKPLAMDLFIDLQVPEDVVKGRAASRYQKAIDAKEPPRPDDIPETVERRQGEFERFTKPMIEQIRRDRPDLKVVDGVAVGIADEAESKAVIRGRAMKVIEEFLNERNTLDIKIPSGLFKGLPEAVKALQNRDMTGIKVLLRTNQNVEINKSGDIEDTIRLEETSPIIEFLLERNAEVYLIGHQGRLEGSSDKRKSLAPTEKFFKARFSQYSVHFYPKSIDSDGFHMTQDQIVVDSTKSRKGSLHIFENVRFADEYEQGEKGSDKREAFGEALANLADIFIFDANGDLDSKGASVEDLPRQFRKLNKEIYIGPSMIKAAAKLEPVVNNGVHVVIAAGEKQDKIEPVMDIVGRNLAPGGFVLLGSAPSAQIGNNILIQTLIERNPLSVIGAKDFNAPGETFDIGPETIKLFLEKLETLSARQNVLVNGALGWVEGGHTKGTEAVFNKLKELAERGVNIFIGGGSGILAAKEYGLDQLKNVVMITGGGTTQKIIAKRNLAAVVAFREALSADAAMVSAEESLAFMQEVMAPFKGLELVKIREDFYSKGARNDQPMRDWLNQLKSYPKSIKGDKMWEDLVTSILLRLGTFEVEEAWTLVTEESRRAFFESNRDDIPDSDIPVYEKWISEKAKGRDSAMTAPGGIDFNPKALDLNIKRDGRGLPLPVSQQPIEMFENLDGFTPIIINIAPIQNLPLILGLKEEDQEQRELSKAL